jgi:NAD(P)-dependent dehydrogenase (short-subunit alcohol dehydrogenase family)
MKVALVTGGRSGIGNATVRALLAAGYSVATTGRCLPALLDAFQDLSPQDLERMIFLEGDATQPDSWTSVVNSTVDAFGKLDLLVNSVGGGTLGQRLSDVSPQEWNSNFLLNLNSTVFTTQAAYPHLCRSKGVVLNFSSILASRPITGLGPYSAAKAAVEMFTKSAAAEWAADGIRVLCISPATIKTEFHTSAGMSKEAAEAYYAASCTTHPLGRVGTPEEVAQMVVTLANPSIAGFMTGSVIHMDGGRLLTSATAGQLQNK